LYPYQNCGDYDASHRRPEDPVQCFGPARNLKHGETENAEIKDQAKKRDRNAHPFGIAAGKNVGTPMCYVAGDRSRISFQRKIQRIEHADE